MRRIFHSLFGMSLVVGSASLAAPDLTVGTRGSASAQEIAAGRSITTRSNARPGVRRYRSYSIEPGAGLPAQGGVVDTAPRYVPSAPAAKRSSKPSFLRGDAKARGQFDR